MSSSPKMPRTDAWMLAGLSSASLVFDEPSGLRVLTILERHADGEWFHVSVTRNAAPASDTDLARVRDEFGMHAAREDNTDPETLARLRAEGRRLGPYPARHLWLRASSNARSAPDEIEAALAMMFPAPPPGWTAGPTVRPKGKKGEQVVRWFVRGDLRVMVWLAHTDGEDAICVGVVPHGRASTKEDVEAARRSFAPMGAGTGEVRELPSQTVLVWTMRRLHAERALVVGRRAGSA